MTTPDPHATKTVQRRTLSLLITAVITYLADVISKIVVVATLGGRPPLRVIGTLLQLNYTRNPGAAFSIGVGYTFVFSFIALAIIVVILRTARRLENGWWALALGLLLGGALGNLTDRIARTPGFLRGWVVDFIQLPHWPIFNVADSAICIGGALMVVLTFRGITPTTSKPEGQEQLSKADTVDE